MLRCGRILRWLANRSRLRCCRRCPVAGRCRCCRRWPQPPAAAAAVALLGGPRRGVREPITGCELRLESRQSMRSTADDGWRWFPASVEQFQRGDGVARDAARRAEQLPEDGLRAALVAETHRRPPFSNPDNYDPDGYEHSTSRSARGCSTTATPRSRRRTGARSPSGTTRARAPPTRNRRRCARERADRHPLPRDRLDGAARRLPLLADGAAAAVHASRATASSRRWGGSRAENANGGTVASPATRLPRRGRRLRHPRPSTSSATPNHSARPTPASSASRCCNATAGRSRRRCTTGSPTCRGRARSRGRRAAPTWASCRTRRRRCSSTKAHPAEGVAAAGGQRVESAERRGEEGRAAAEPVQNGRRRLPRARRSSTLSDAKDAGNREAAIRTS